MVKPFQKTKYHQIIRCAKCNTLTLWYVWYREFSEGIVEMHYKCNLCGRQGDNYKMSAQNLKEICGRDWR